MNSQVLYERFTDEEPPAPHPIINSVSCKRMPNPIRSVVFSTVVGEMRHYQSGQLRTIKSLGIYNRPKEGLHDRYPIRLACNAEQGKDATYSNDGRMVRGAELEMRSRNTGSSYRNKENKVVTGKTDSPDLEATMRRAGKLRLSPDNKSLGPAKVKRIGLEYTHRLINNDVVRYEDMKEKLNILEEKFASMRVMLANKREDRLRFLQAQQKERAELGRLRSEKYQRNKEELRRRSLEKPLKVAEYSKDALKTIVTQVEEAKGLRYMNHNPYSATDKLYYVSYVLSTYKDPKSAARQHIAHSLKSLKAMQHCRKRTLVELLPKSVSLSKKEHYRDKKTVVFDLDETLVHCNESLDHPYDIRIKIRLPNGENTEAGVNIRPYAQYLLYKLSANFEIIVFTASHACYANAVLDYLDPQGKYIAHRLFRENCYEGAEGMFVKDLRIFNRSLNSIVLIDNAAYSFCLQLDNAIPIIPYYSGENDFYLRALEKYIEQLAGVPDVRDLNRSTFKLDRYLSFDDPQRLVEELYQ